MADVFKLARDNLSPTNSGNVLNAIGADVQREFDKNVYVKNAMSYIGDPRRRD